MEIKDWIQIGSTVALAVTALITPVVAEWFKSYYRLPKLRIRFKLASPDCHQTQMIGEKVNFPVYYFRFLVENYGKTQAEECEVLLEKISKANSAGKMIEDNNFTPVNLKWTGIWKPYERTIQPGRAVYCDLGRVQSPNYNYQSIYRGISPEEQEVNKFAFELPEKYYSQWDCLTPGKYEIGVSVYSKNCKKTSRKFSLSWSGKWKDKDSEMFNELVVT